MSYPFLIYFPIRIISLSTSRHLLVLKELLERNYKGIFLMSALGPGFSAGLVEVEIDDY